MLKSYTEFLLEQEDIDYKVKSFVSIDIITGDIHTTLDPQAENWQSQIEHLKDYLNLQRDIKDALNKGNVGEIQTIVVKAKETPLFSLDPTRVWKILQSDPGVTDEGFSRWCGRYILNTAYPLRSS